MPTSRSSALPAVYSLAFFVAFLLSVVMLLTDQNLQTDFGTITNGYYIHWYAVLVTAVIDLIGGLLLLWVRSPTMVKLGVLGSGLLSVFLVGVIAAYSQVGFASASQYADYLFGVTYYGKDIRYLYDVLLATYIATFLIGLVVLRLTRLEPDGRAPTDPDPRSDEPA
jgi:hypothetical protein